MDDLESRADAIRQWRVPDPGTLAPDLRGFLCELGGPAWIEVPGRDPSRWRLVVTLLHGNEPSGAHAIHAWLRAGREAAVNVAFYVGSVEAALAGRGFEHRFLPGERDANRVYGVDRDDRQGRIARDFTRRFRARRFEALVDIHNNTGRNPAYGVGYGADAARLNLTALFGDWYMNADVALHTVMEMAGNRCPAVAVECGRAGDAVADALALAGLQRYVEGDDLGLDEPPPRHLRVLDHPLRVRLVQDVSFAFRDTPSAAHDLTLRADIDRHNFEPMPTGTAIGWIREGAPWPLRTEATDQPDRAAEWFACRGGRLLTRRPMIPMMMTTDAVVAGADCLFYAVADG